MRRRVVDEDKVKRVYISLNDDGRSAAERHREKVHVVVRTLDAKINSRHKFVYSL